MINNRVLFSSAILFIVLQACSYTDQNTGSVKELYKPDSLELYQAIVHLDSIYFAAYNNCNMSLQASFYSDSIEFYHDKGGLMTSKQEILDGIKKYVCGKVTRELVPGSIEVYPIKDYGAVEMGAHTFHNREEREVTPPHAGKFVIIWQHLKNQWKIRRVISLH